MIDKDKLRIEFSKRLNSALDNAGIRPHGRGVDIQNELKRKGLKASTESIRKWLSGLSIPSIDNMKALAEMVGVSVAWLQFGESLNESKDKYAIGNVEPVKGFMSVNQNIFRYPVISWVSAGQTCEAWQPEYADDYINTDVNAGENGFWLKVKGDSMTNSNGISFPDGVFILVSPISDIYSEKFVVAKITDTNEATFKQYIEEAGIKYLKPLNSAYKMQELDGRWQIIGKVVDARWRLN